MIRTAESLQAPLTGASLDVAAHNLGTLAVATLPPAPDLRCRVYELEVENARLRLLVGELLVANQRLREENEAIRTGLEPSLTPQSFAKVG